MTPPLKSHLPLRTLFIPILLVLLLVTLACSSEEPPTPPPTQPPAAATATTAPPPTTPPNTPATPAPSPTPTPTAPPTPTASPTRPSPTPTPTTAPTQSPQDQLADASEHIYALLQELLEELGHRESASPEELFAAESIQDRLQSLGYSTKIQPFTFRYFDYWRWYRTAGETANVVLQDTEYIGVPLAIPPTSLTFTGPLTPVELESNENLSPEAMSGAVAWFQPKDGILPDEQSLHELQQAISKVAEAGAAAVVISGTQDSYRHPALLAFDSPIPALLFDTRVENPWTEAMANGDLEIAVHIEVEKLESRNVIAEMKGSGDGLVIIGAHYDVVPETEAGANDNTSGVAVLLSLAEALAGRSLPYTIRFVAFGSEEIGLYGSRHYVESLDEAELARITAMLNFDVVGSGPHLEAAGHEALANLALSIANELGIEAQPGTLPPGAASDHTPFDDADVPTLFLFAPDISRIHTPEDRLEFVQPELLSAAYLIGLAILQSENFGQ